MTPLKLRRGNALGGYPGYGGSRVRDDRDSRDHAVVRMEAGVEQTPGDRAGEAESEARSDDDRDGAGGCGESRYGSGCESGRVGNQGDSFERRVHDARVR
ncbi:unnamed protein product [Malus baccata var. baccata]